MHNQASNKTIERPLLIETGVNYSIAGLLPVILSFIVSMIFMSSMGAEYAKSDEFKYMAYLLPQLCFAGAALFFFRRNRYTVSARSVYRPCKWYYFVLALGLAFGLLSLSELNGYFIALLGKIGYHAPESTLPTVSGWYLVPAMLVIAVLPAIFEETIFRGIQVGSMQRSGWSTAATLLITGAMFSLFHGNPAQTIYQFICGVCYGLIAVRSGSILPTILAHFANNAIILSLTSAGYTDIPQNAKLPLYTAAGVVLLAVLVYLIFFQRRGSQKGGTKGGLKYFLAALVGIIVCVAEWIAALIQGLA